MKLSRTSWALLVGGILLILFASLGFAGTRQFRQQEKLNDDLIVAEQRVAKMQLEQLSARQEQLKTDLEKANAELKNAQDKLRQANESIPITDFLFQIADSCSVTIDDMTTPGLTVGDVAKINCAVLSLSLTASGDLLDLIHFIARLNTDFGTGMIRSSEITIPESSEDLPSVRIQISVYNYRG